MVTMDWVVSRSRLKAPPGTSSPYIAPLTPSGQRNCASWASQPQKSVTLPPQPGGGDHESSYEHVVALEKEKNDFMNSKGILYRILIQFWDDISLLCNGQKPYSFI